MKHVTKEPSTVQNSSHCIKRQIAKKSRVYNMQMTSHHTKKDTTQ